MFLLWQELNFYTLFIGISVFKAVPWGRQLVASLSPRLPGFQHGPIHVLFVVQKLALGQVSLQTVWFVSCQLHFTNVPHTSSISALLYTEQQMGKAWQTSIWNDAFSKIREHQDTKSTLIFSSYKGLMIICRTASVLI